MTAADDGASEQAVRDHAGIAAISAFLGDCVPALEAMPYAATPFVCPVDHASEAMPYAATPLSVPWITPPVAMVGHTGGARTTDPGADG
jgi:hypothetical protein